MKPQARNPRETEDDSSEISPTALFTALSEKRRQHALAYLAQKPAAIYLGDLAEYIAIGEDDPSYERYQRIVVDLHHRHLPHLREAGIVRYDAETELIELTIDRDAMAPYLAIVERAE